jgi:hypothetical protein
MVLGFTQPLTELSTSESFCEVKLCPARKAESFTAISEPIVYTMWVPQHLTTL